MLQQHRKLTDEFPRDTVVSFYKKYELVGLIREGECKTFNARERAGGRRVLLHILEPEVRAASDSLAAKAKAVEGNPLVVEIGEFAGSVYMVTESIEPFTTLREWVQAQPEYARSASRAAEVPSPQLQSVDVLSPPAVRTQGAPSPVGAPAAPATILPLNDSGECPRPAAQSADPKGEAPPRPSPPPLLAGDAQGEFTRLLGGAPLSKRLAAPPADAVPSNAAGEFTRLFGGPPLPSAPKPPVVPVPPVSAAPGVPAMPAAQAARPVPAPTTPAALYEQAARPAPAAQAMPPAEAAGPAPPAPTTPAAGESGEFTRIVKVAPSAAEAKPPAARLPESSEPGELTRFFGPGLRGDTLDISQHFARRSPEPASRPFQQAGVFSRMFGFGGAPGGRSQPSVPPVGSVRPGPASQLFGSPEDLLRQAKAAAPPAETGGPSKKPEETGERAGVVLPQPEESAQPAVQAPPIAAAIDPMRGNRPEVWAAIGGGALLVLILAILVVYLRKGA